MNAPVVHVSTMGNLANQMMQYLVAASLGARAGHCAFSNVNLPPWGIVHPWVEGDFPHTEIVTDPAPDLDRLARALTVGQLQRVDIRTYGQRIGNFPDMEVCRELFRHQGPAYAGAGPDELLCNIRQGDILDAVHPDYVLIPADFYADLAEETGLRLVFMGQLDDSPYLAQLRARFPQARFLPSRGAAADFERIRRSRYVVPSISTFGWLAAWLSEAERVFQPVLGAYAPVAGAQRGSVAAERPRATASICFRSITRCRYSVSRPRMPRCGAYGAICRRRGWRPCWHGRRRPGRRNCIWRRSTKPSTGRRIRTIARAIDEGHFPSGRTHYELYGFDEGRAGFALDRAWYCREYPIAAVELSQGEYADADHHWLEIGRARAYRQAGG